MLQEAERAPEYWAAAFSHEFAEALVERMKGLDLNQTALADLLGTSRANVSKALRGDANLTILTMTRMARALGGVLHVEIAEPGARPSWDWQSAAAATVVGFTGTRPPLSLVPKVDAAAEDSIADLEAA